MRDLAKGHAALRRGRVSILHAEYFLTICTNERRTGLTTLPAGEEVLAQMIAMVADATWHLRCAVVMPDHLHLLAILGERLSLGKCVARLKSKSSGVLCSVSSALEWERDFFDHHLSPDEDRLSLFLYIYLNPYRGNLCARTERWPWHYCCDEDWTWFKDSLDADRPQPEWLR